MFSRTVAVCLRKLYLSEIAMSVVCIDHVFAQFFASEALSLHYVSSCCGFSLRLKTVFTEFSWQNNPFSDSSFSWKRSIFVIRD